MKVGIIGFGSMGSMIARKLLEHNVISQSELTCANRTLAKMDGFKKQYPDCTVTDNNKFAAKADVVFVCIRPAELKDVLCGIAAAVSKDTLVVSLNGSVMFSQLESVLAEKTRIAKVIPSVNAEVDYSVTSVCYNKYVEPKDKANLEALLKSFGTVTEVAENELGMASELTSLLFQPRYMLLPLHFRNLRITDWQKQRKRSSEVCRPPWAFPEKEPEMTHLFAV